VQQRTVSGIVVDQSGKPLGGVSVYIRDWLYLPREQRSAVSSTATDENGHWSIPVPSDTTVLVFSFIGYEKQEIRVGDQRSLAVSMQPDAKSVEEVIVIGYGTTTRKQNTGSVSSITSEQISKQT